jgi:hypothetical protein
MSTSLELRADIARLRLILEEIIDEDAAERVRAMIHELAQRTHKLDNGSGAEH